MRASMILKELLSSGETVVMPDAFDPLSARIIERMGFKAVQCSGFSIAAAQVMAEPALSRDCNVAITAAIVQAISIPVMADGEDGFGDEHAIPETIRAYIKAGVAGINIEDQVLGAPGGKQLVPMDVAVGKLYAARKAAADAGVPDLIINARTDALMANPTPEEGLAGAIVRTNAYLQAGADLAFIIGVSDLEQVRLLVREIHGPISIAAGMPNNMGLSVAQLREAGVARVSLPSLLLFSALQAMQRSLESVQRTGGFEEIVAGEWTCGMGDIMRLLAPT